MTEPSGKGKGRHASSRPKTIPIQTETKRNGKPSRPDVLQGESLAEWDRMVKLLDKLEILHRADGSALALYCTQYARWKKAEEELAEHGYTQLVKDFERQSPWVQISNDATKMMKELLKEFGLTPASRAKLMPETEQKPAQNAVVSFLQKPKSAAN